MLCDRREEEDKRVQVELYQYGVCEGGPVNSKRSENEWYVEV